jgi:hypothetical protein
MISGDYYFFWNSSSRLTAARRRYFNDGLSWFHPCDVVMFKGLCCLMQICPARRRDDDNVVNQTAAAQINSERLMQSLQQQQQQQLTHGKSSRKIADVVSSDHEEAFLQLHCRVN